MSVRVGTSQEHGATLTLQVGVGGGLWSPQNRREDALGAHQRCVCVRASVHVCAFVLACCRYVEEELTIQHCGPLNCALSSLVLSLPVFLLSPLPLSLPLPPLDACCLWVYPPECLALWVLATKG